MKTYVVQFPPKGDSVAIGAVFEAVTDAMLRGFELAVKSASTYKWRNLNLGSATGPRWFDTDCENAVSALSIELSNIGVKVSEQPRMPEADDSISWEDWERAAERSWR